jgi:hypothetical protein
MAPRRTRRSVILCGNEVLLYRFDVGRLTNMAGLGSGSTVRGVGALEFVLSRVLCESSQPIIAVRAQARP